MSEAYHLWIPRLLLLLLVLIQCTDSASVVTHLPGFEGPLPFHLETGYIGVGEDETAQLFYYFIKSESNPLKDPLLLWLTGGHGCSSFTGLVFELGPLKLNIEDYNGGLPSLVSTTYSWTKEASIIFLDQPVGTGFSYSTTPLSHEPSDTGEAKQTYEFLQKWLLEHQEFVSNPFYLAGDSYSGMTVPPILQHISIGNENGNKPLINLQGYVLGNPKTDRGFDLNYRVSYAHGMGLISNELYESLMKSCKRNVVNIDPRNTQCLKWFQYYTECIARINLVNILTPLCENQLAEEHDGGRRRRFLKGSTHSNISLTSSHCYNYRYFVVAYWANDKRVREALHVVKGSIGDWVRCNRKMAYNSDIESCVPHHKYLSSKGSYRSLVYSGDHDLLVSFVGTHAWITSLNYSIIDDWRPWFLDNQVLGYTRTYANNMTFATVKGGGHTADYKPEESSVMFKRWIHGQPL